MPGYVNPILQSIAESQFTKYRLQEAARRQAALDKAKRAHAGEDFIKGSSDIPLSKFGLQRANRLSRKIAAKGGFDEIVSSDLSRAQQTASAISGGGKLAAVASERLQPWRLGKHEGRATEEVLPIMRNLIKHRPDEPIPGRSPQSTADGESFNTFKRRFLTYVRGLIRAGNRGDKLLVVTHRWNLKVLEAWIKNGAPPDLTIDTDEMAKKDDSKPGDVFRLEEEGGSLRLHKVDVLSRAPLAPGIYFARHETTALNRENRATSITTPYTRRAVP